jgi:hypothetical protein
MKKYFIVIILLLGLQSCKTDNVDDYELKVLDEIFDDLIRQMGVVTYYMPPPPPPIIDCDDIIEYDTFDFDEFIKGIEIIKIDTTVVIAVFDSLFTCYGYEDIKRKINFTEDGYNEAFDAMKDSSITSRPLLLSKIKNREKIVLRYYSEFPDGNKILETENYDFLLSGVLSISRIYFDSSYQFALIYCCFVGGPNWGEGVIFCIRKINNKWSIEKKISLWIS